MHKAIALWILAATLLVAPAQSREKIVYPGNLQELARRVNAVCLTHGQPNFSEKDLKALILNDLCSLREFPSEARRKNLQLLAKQISEGAPLTVPLRITQFRNQALRFGYETPDETEIHTDTYWSVSLEVLDLNENDLTEEVPLKLDWHPIRLFVKAE